MTDEGRQTSGGALPFLSAGELDYWQQMPGFLLPAAALRLHQAAAEAPSGGVIVEIGSFAGKSLVCLAHGAMSRGPKDPLELVAVDVHFHHGWEAAIGHLGLRHLVTPVEVGSVVAADTWNRPISLLYIDADHGPAHARVDFVAWEPFVVAGGIVALDDTVGFYPGCTLAVQMALADGRYELVDDVGGVTFLRKRAPLFDGIGFAPLLGGSAFAEIAATSAWTGAMDPSLRLPMPVSFKLSDEMIDDRLSRVLESIGVLRGRLASDLSEDVLPTVDYLEGVVRAHSGQNQLSLALFDALTDGPNRQFFHYELPVVPLARLRRAQVLDLLGRRAEAVVMYADLAETCAIPGVRESAIDGRDRVFAIPTVVPGRLLRDYVLESPFERYRLLRPRRS